MTAGNEYPYNPRGRCVFLTSEDRCNIHGVKPQECADYFCKVEPIEDAHRATAVAWATPEAQQQILDLLKHEPALVEPESVFEVMLGLFPS